MERGARQQRHQHSVAISTQGSTINPCVARAIVVAWRPRCTGKEDGKDRPVHCKFDAEDGRLSTELCALGSTDCGSRWPFLRYISRLWKMPWILLSRTRRSSRKFQRCRRWSWSRKGSQFMHRSSLWSSRLGRNGQHRAFRRHPTANRRADRGHCSAGRWGTPRSEGCRSDNEWRRRTPGGAKLISFREAGMTSSCRDNRKIVFEMLDQVEGCRLWV